MPEVVKLENGKLRELVVPGLLVVKKTGGDWTTIKPLVGVTLNLNGWLDVDIAGWYVFNGTKPRDLTAGPNSYKFSGSKDQFMTGPWP